MSGNLEIAFLADRKEAAPIVAQWYFDEWGGENSVNSISETLLLGSNGGFKIEVQLNSRNIE